MSQKTGFVWKYTPFHDFFFRSWSSNFGQSRDSCPVGWGDGHRSRSIAFLAVPMVGGQNLKISTAEELRNWWWWNSPGDPRFQPGLDMRIEATNDGWSTHGGIEHDRTADIFGNRSCWLLVSFVYMILSRLWIINPRDSKNTSGRSPLVGTRRKAPYILAEHSTDSTSRMKSTVWRAWFSGGWKLKEWLSPKNGWFTIHHNTR